MSAKRAAALGALLAGIALTGCAGSAADSNPAGVTIYTTANPHGFRGAYLDHPYRRPAVTLTDTAGRPYSLVSDMTKPVTLVVFVYSHCPDVCPTGLADLAATLRRVDPQVRSQTDVLVITTDPDRDTAPVLRDYLDRFDPSFIGLTGPLSEIKTAADGLGVALTDANRLPGGGYEIGHGAQVIGFGRDGGAHLIWTPGTSVADLRHDLTVLAGLA